MTRYLSWGQLMRVAEAAVGHTVEVRDAGLVESALYRPQSSVLGQDAYPTLGLKAAALLQSLATNHGLVDGNKRTAVAATYAFMALNGTRLALSEDAVVQLALDVANKHLTTVEEIAERLRR